MSTVSIDELAPVVPGMQPASFPVPTEVVMTAAGPRTVVVPPVETIIATPSTEVIIKPALKVQRSFARQYIWLWVLITVVVATLVFWFIFWLANPNFSQYRDANGNPTGDPNQGIIFLFALVIGLILGLIVWVCLYATLP